MSLRNWICRFVTFRYEVIGVNDHTEPWIVWAGAGSFHLASGFYLTEEAARRAVALVPDGYTPTVYELGEYVKREVYL
jgi:hypothetical protein